MESDDEDAPESIIPASSPESNIGDEAKRFPHLREPKEEETERAISPIIPLIPRTAIPGTSQQKKTWGQIRSYIHSKRNRSTKNKLPHFLPAFPENKPIDGRESKVASTSNHWEKAKSNEVSVTLTLSSAAAKVRSATVDSVQSALIFTGCKVNLDFFQKLNHVMMAMAQLLNIQMPGSYELSFPPQNPDMPGFVGPGKAPTQSGTSLESHCLIGSFKFSKSIVNIKKVDVYGFSRNVAQNLSFMGLLFCSKLTSSVLMQQLYLSVGTSSLTRLTSCIC